MKRRKGFTLAELIVTISIVVVLSVISYPIYTRKSADAKLAEGYALLGIIIDKQKDYYAEYGEFLEAINSVKEHNAFTFYDPVLGINAVNNRYFTSFCISKFPPGERRKREFQTVVKSKNAGSLTAHINITARHDIIYNK